MPASAKLWTIISVEHAVEHGEVVRDVLHDIQADLEAEQPPVHAEVRGGAGSASSALVADFPAWPTGLDEARIERLSGCANALQVLALSANARSIQLITNGSAETIGAVVRVARTCARGRLPLTLEWVVGLESEVGVDAGRTLSLVQELRERHGTQAWVRIDEHAPSDLRGTLLPLLAEMEHSSVDMRATLSSGSGMQASAVETPPRLAIPGRRTLSDIKTRFSESGYAVVPGLVPESLVDWLQERRRALLGDPHYRSFHFEDPHAGFIASMHKLADHIDGYGAAMMDSLTTLASAVFGDVGPWRIVDSTYFAKAPHVGPATIPHQDNFFLRLDPADVVTLWFSTSRVSSARSNLVYYAGSHLQGIRHHALVGPGRFGIPIEELEGCGSPQTEVGLNFGDCVIHDGRVVHGSTPNTADSARESFNITIASVRS